MLATAVLAVSVLVFQQDTNVAYVVFPLLIWAVLRFWQPGVAFANLAVATIAVAFTANGSGPFVRSNPDDSLLLAQTYFGVTGITVLLLAAVVTERRRAEELSRYIARTLQESLLPARLPEIPAIELAARFRAAGDAYRVGGDFYDVFKTRAGSWAIVIGDVCGKGPEAAAVTALARYTIREAAVHEQRPSGVLTLLNDAIRRQRPANEFCTVAYVDLGVDGDRADVTFSTGGHPLPLLLRAGGTVEPVGRHGLALGIDADPKLMDHRIEMDRGDALLLYTDGLTDAHAPAQPLEPGDLATLLASFRGRAAAEIAHGIQAALLGSAATEPRDDVAIVVLRIAV